MGFDISFWSAFFAGLVSFISPCILPIVPPYLCYLAGISLDELTESRENTKAAAGRVFIAALAFVFGFATVFISLGATASFVGKAITQYLDTLSILAGVVILIMGLHFLGLFKISMLYREARVQVKSKPAGLAGSYLMGLAFAFGWTPCVGPVLAAILFVAGAEDSAMRGATLLFSYSMGIGLPFLAAALFAGPFMNFMARFKKHLGKVEKFMGAMLVITGIMFMTGQVSRVSAWMLETFPVFNSLLL